MKVVTQLDEARKLLADSVERMEDWADKLAALPDDAPEEEAQFVRGAFEKEQHTHKRAMERVDNLSAIEVAKAETHKRTIEDDEKEQAAEKEQRRYFADDNRVKSEPATYSPKTSREGRSFFRDMIFAQSDGEARERLQRHSLEMRVEHRDLTTTATAGGNFVPPMYLGDLYAGMPRAGRPFADAIPNRPLASTGMSITIPRITTGTSVAAQATENTAISETDIVEAMLTVNVRTYAGQQDVSRQLFDRSEPGIDEVIFSDLRSDYDTKIDNALLNGAGTLGTHLGIRAVSSVNTVTYTDASPTAAETVPPIYNAAQQIWSNRFAAPDLIVMHPRRSAFLASNLGTSFPLFQLGNLNQAAGTQDGTSLTNNIAGLRVVNDANVRTTDGASTNQDEIYVVRAADLIFWEGPLQAEVMTQTAPPTTTDTLTVRLRLFAYSAFASGRYPKSITVISGTGLTAPTF